VPGTHVLLDYENVQPTEDELRAIVPDAGQVWVFHGPHQRQVEQRFASFGDNATAVPISKTGKNALDFHLSFYVGYIAARNPTSAMVVVSNDKGYEPMLEHARAMGFAVRQQGHGQAKPAASVKGPSAAKTGAAPRPAAKKAAAKKAAAKQPAVKRVPAKKAAAKKAAAAPVAKKVQAKKVAPAKQAAVKPSIPPPSSSPATSLTVSADSIKKITDNLRKMGVKRPVKPASLRRALKSFLGAETGDRSIEAALDKLIAAGVVSLGAKSDVTYPRFEPLAGAVFSDSGASGKPVFTLGPPQGR
jgi:hypothetical protein